MDKTKYTTDLSNKQLIAERAFDAPVSLVWRAWTEPELIDQWWAPKPYQAVTQFMDFTEGSEWRYAMRGPEGDEHKCKVEYEKISPQTGFSGMDGFCDENWKLVSNPPSMHWDVAFMDQGDKTLVKTIITFESEEALNTIVEMGMKEGFAAAHENLDELLSELGKT